MTHLFQDPDQRRDLKGRGQRLESCLLGDLGQGLTLLTRYIDKFGWHTHGASFRPTSLQNTIQ